MYLHSALKLLALSDPVGVRGRGRNQVVNKGKHTHCATVLWQKHRQEGEVYALTLAHAHTHTDTPRMINFCLVASWRKGLTTANAMGKMRGGFRMKSCQRGSCVTKQQQQQQNYDGRGEERR